MPYLFLRVSIHAPRTGRDVQKAQALDANQSFNPRAPHGARQWSSRKLTTAVAFQSTRPARGATKARTGLPSTERVSIHAPRTGRDRHMPHLPNIPGEFQSTRPARGATYQPPISDRHEPCFNPRAPHGARLRSDSRDANLRSVSIHAPRTGRDYMHWGCDFGAWCFNPRAPHGARR